MKITESQLRRMIREELKRDLNEMPYGGTLSGPGGEDVRMKPGREIVPPGIKKASNPDVTSKLFKSAKFKSDAERLYTNIPYKVWLAPIFGVSTGEHLPNPDDDSDRMAFANLSKVGVARLVNFGFMLPDDIDTRNDLVIAVISPLAGRLTVPDGKLSISSSPWTIFHAIFDSSIGYKRDAIDELVPGYQDFVKDLTRIFGEPKILKRLVGALSMGAARKGEIFSPWDAAAEMMVQELIDKRRLRLDLSGLEPEERAQLAAFGDRVRELAQAFRENAQGKLIVITG